MASEAPDWATHKAMFCGIVPVWYADDGEGCKLVGRGWLADSVLLPIVTSIFVGRAPFSIGTSGRSRLPSFFRRRRDDG